MTYLLLEMILTMELPLFYELYYFNLNLTMVTNQACTYRASCI